MSKRLTVQDVIGILEDFRRSAENNEHKFIQEWADAGPDEVKRQIAYTSQQVATGQKMVLKTVLDEIAKRGGENLRFSEPPDLEEE